MIRDVSMVLMLCLSLIYACSVQTKIKDGTTAYERRQYAVAVNLLEQELAEKATPQVRARKYFLLGDAWMRLLQYREALSAFGMATENGYGPEAMSAQARAHKALEEYTEAINIYRKLGEISGKRLEADRDILICQQALDNKKKKPVYQIEKVFENSTVSDYAPALFEDRFLVFTSERKEATGKNPYQWTGEKFVDLFIMSRSGSEVQKFDAFLNTSGNEGAAWFTRSMERVYFTRCQSDEQSDSFCQLVYSDRDNGFWSEPVVLPFTLPGVNYGQPTLIENDSVLVFSSDLAEPGGPRDLFYSVLLPDGSWSAPDGMPSTINTQGNELFPTADGDTLYFSSDYLPGMGGFDIFKSYLRKDGSWAPAENVGYPVNSGGDDFSFVVDYNAKPRPRVVQQGFFVSSRDQAGKDDLYRFARLLPEPARIDSTPSENQKKDLFLVVRSYEPIYQVSDDPNSGVMGKKLLGNTQIRLYNPQKGFLSENRSDANGFYFSQVSPSQAYQITVSRTGYLSSVLQFDGSTVVFAPGETSVTVNKEVLLEKIYPQKEIRLENIYYDFDSWEILPAAMPSLNRLADILKANPMVRIQLTSHTDCRGEVEYNLVLSQKRAQAAVDFLSAQGIASNRMIAVGRGEEALVEMCPCESCTEEQHQANRRTTFMILENP